MTGRLPAAVLWDFDGTLMDTETIWYRVEEDYVFSHGGHLTPGWDLNCVGGTMAQTVSYFREVAGVDVDPDVMAAELWRGCHEALASGPIPWTRGVRELVDALASAGVPQAIVSNSDRSYLDLVLNRLDPDPFAFVVSGNDVQRPKPDPEPYALACSRFGVDAADVVVIEDSAAGVASGLAAGCSVIVVPTVGEFAPAPRLTVRSALAGLTIEGLASAMSAGVA